MVLVDVAVPATGFPVGALTAETPATAIELVRVVPIDGVIVPLFWAVGRDLTGFERSAGALEQVERLSLVESHPGRRLYRVWWRPEATTLVSTIHRHQGAILDGRGTDEWHFFVRFPDEGRFESFFAACTRAGIPVDATEYSPVG
ncbi:bacterio-opsin activator domain-containing protein [Haloarchaeobius amylolyticus]|uniref:bacterio-opsin activator domain-containing protein n=1 Tax=Haloarchaeobius amylolyticus TaxID=1198296 RepID=UPI00226D9255|nr:bacterio-opsin activator domain-containing protein [Haloarchaeobius amylolyticus]